MQTTRMDAHADAAAAVFAQARAACKQSLFARPLMGYIGAASYMHTADRDSIVNLTTHDYSAYIICGKQDGRFVFYEESVEKNYAEEQVRSAQIGLRWYTLGLQSGWIPTFIVLVGSALLFGHIR